MAFGAKVKLSVNTSGAKSFRNEIQRFVDDSTSSNPIKVKNIKLELNKSQQSQLKRNIQSYLDASGDNLKIKINKIDASGAVKQLRSQLETMLSGLSITGLKDFLGTDGISSTYERAAVAAEKLATAQENVKRKSQEVNASVQILKTLQNSANSAYTYGNKLTNAEQVGKISSEYQSLCVLIEKAKTLEGEEQQVAINGIVEKTAALRKYIEEQYESQAVSKRAAQEEEASLSKVNSLYKKLNTYATNNPRVMKDGYLSGNITSWMSMLTSGVKMSTNDLSEIESGFAKVVVQARQAGLEGKTFGDKVLAAYQKFGGWTIITRTLTAVIHKFKEMVKIVTELDTAMTELKKVTDLTEQSYDKVFERAITRAKTLGTTVSDAITATADFARLGYEVSDAEKLADAAIIYKNVGDGIESISDASESLISTMKAFDIQADESMSIVDKFNEVGNNFAISSKGVGEALQRSASAMAVAGNTLDETIALAVGMNAVVQNPEKVGTVLKTASMYLRAAKTDLEEAGEETEGMAKSVSELRHELLLLTNNKVDIMADKNTFKSTIQIYRELAAIWDELADVDAANILELIGGKRNATANASVLKNFKDVEDALVTSANSAGSALAENEKFLQSIQGRIDKLKASFQGFSATFIDSGLVKTILSFSTVLLDVLTALDKMCLLLPLITLSITALIVQKNRLQLAESNSMINTLASSILREKTVTDTLASSIVGLTIKQKKQLISQLESTVAFQAMDNATKSQILSTIGLTSAEEALTATNTGLATSFKAVGLSIPVWGWVVAAISALLSAAPYIVDWIKRSHKSLEDLNKEWDELSDELTNISNKFKDLNSSAKDVIPRFVELASGVDQFGKNVGLTDEEYTEFLSLNNKIAEMFPELNLGMDSNGNAMLNLSYSADTLSDSLWDLVEAQRAVTNDEYVEKIPKTIENITKTVEKYENSINNLKDKITQTQSGTFVRSVSGVADDALADAKSVQEFYDFVEFLKSHGVEVQEEVKRIGVSGSMYTATWDVAQTKTKNAVAGIEREINNLEHNISAKWKQLNPLITAWMQTDFLYQDMDEDVQSLVTKMLSGVDYHELGLETEESIKEYISDNIITPIHDAEPEVQNALMATFSLKDLFNNGTITTGEYRQTLEKILSDLSSIGVGDEEIATLKLSLNTKDFEEKITYAKNLLRNESKQEAEKLGIDLSQTIFGNIDLNERQVLDWTDENISKYRAIMKSWGEEIEEYRNSISTVDGRSEEFDGVEIAFTPMLQTEEGAVYLDSDTVHDYINALIENAGEGWHSEDLLRLDVEGLEIDGRRIKGLIADIGETAQRTGEIMHFLGKDGAIALEEKEIQEFIDSLSNKELELAVQIKEADGSMTFDELKAKIEELRIKTSPMVNVLDFTDMFSGLDKAKDGIDNLVSAMDKLKNGTALTKQELAQLALEYPKLLEASNLFTDGSVEGQKNMLNAILDMQEQEYDAEIDKKIAELEATEQVLNDQLELENQKAQLIQDIKNIEVNGVLGQESELVSKISDLNDLQGKNFVNMQDGVLTVNQEAINQHLKQDEEFGTKSATNIWTPYAKTIKTAHTKGFSAALQAANSYGSNLASWAKNISSNILSGLSNAIKDALDPNAEWKGIKTYFSGVNTNISTPDLTVTFDGNSVAVGNQGISDWVSQQERASKERIEKTQELLQKTINAKNNLAALKGLDLPEIYGKDKSGGDKSGKDKDVEEYIAEVERYNEALQKLKDLEQEQTRLERELENADNAFDKVEIQKKLNQVYKDSQDALHELNNLRDETIHNTIPQLEALGFQIEYNDETNRLYISNLEHLNELQADSAGKYETVQEATNALRKETEDLIDGITDLNEANADSSEEWLKLADSIKEGKNKIVEYLNEAVTEAVNFVSAMQDIRDTLKEAADEYADMGSISVDSLKAIAEYGAEYLAYLKDENGQLVINKDRINDVIAARTRQLAVDTALSYVEKIRDALNEGKVKELDRLITATEKASDATWGLVYSNLALLNLDDSQYKRALDNINKLRSLAESAVKTIYSQADEDSSSATEKKKDALDKILDLTMDLIKYEKEQEVKALEDQIDKYEKIIDLKKKSLNTSKEENKYSKEVAAKVKAIAELQSKINKLSLDDSREAQAEKKSLEKELVDLQTDLADYQADYSLEKQIDALDDEFTAYEDTKNKEIKKVEDTVSSTEKLYQLAIERITNNWDSLYGNIISWNYDTGSTIESEIVSAWKLASEAVQEYGSYVEAVNKTTAGKVGNEIVSDSNNYGDPKPIINSMKANSLRWLISDEETQQILNKQNKDYKAQLERDFGYSITYNDGSYINDATGESLYPIDKWEAVDYITQAMWRNSQAWSGASKDKQALLEASNIKMAGYIESLTGQEVRIKDGVWYIGNDELYKSYGFIYHDGGIAGNTGGIKDNEILALLEKGELVLDQQKKDTLYRYIDISAYMMKKFGAAIENLNEVTSINPQLLDGGYGKLSDKTALLSAISEREKKYVIESVQVTAPIQVLQKLDEDAIREYSKTIGDISAKYIQEGFSRKGI